MSAGAPPPGRPDGATHDAVVGDLWDDLRRAARVGGLVGPAVAALGSRAAAPVVRGVGEQTTAWAVFALGLAATGRRLTLPGPADAAQARARLRRLHRLTVLNAVGDLAYLATGAALVATGTGRRRGAGIGVLAQAGYLLHLDRRHAARLAAAARTDRP